MIPRCRELVFEFHLSLETFGGSPAIDGGILAYSSSDTTVVIDSISSGKAGHAR